MANGRVDAERLDANGSVGRYFRGGDKPNWEGQPAHLLRRNGEVSIARGPTSGAEEDTRGLSKAEKGGGAEEEAETGNNLNAAETICSGENGSEHKVCSDQTPRETTQSLHNPYIASASIHRPIH